MATQLDSDPLFLQRGEYFQQALPSSYRAVLKKFRKIATSFVHFNLLFLSLIILELVVFGVCFSWGLQTTLFAISLSVFLLTCFSYFVLLFYFQAQKPDELFLLKEEFLSSCRSLLSAPDGFNEHHLSIAEALTRLASYLHEFERDLYKIPALLQFAQAPISTFSAYWYWEDVFKMKQQLLEAAIEEHIKQIRITPTDLEVHASLAHTYVSLSKLSQSILESNRKAHKSKTLNLEEKASLYARLAMEEFKILSQYAAEDPWVHEQMASGYKNLALPQEEIREVEILRQLRPHDKEILCRLGALYFSQGHNAKGLLVYEELKTTNLKKAEELIASYGTSRLD